MILGNRTARFYTCLLAHGTRLGLFCFWSPPSFGAATPVASIDVGAENGWPYDVTSDGRILMIRDSAGSTEQDHLVVVDGWFDELKRLEAAASSR